MVDNFMGNIAALTAYVMDSLHMIMSSNENIFWVTGHLCGELRGALMFSLIWVWINGWVNNREAGDLRPYSANYDVTVMQFAPDMAVHNRQQYPHHQQLTGQQSAVLLINHSDIMQNTYRWVSGRKM